ncbi:MAG: AraC family transcriptional regulator [Neobacillus sp.]|jgi:AraC-like DNA-binding protein|nr:AraC family transcriptional regulator [Neobacillus sp.]
MTEKIISISMPPFPDFIEGNQSTFQKGQLHPDRRNLGYFDLLFVKSGTLYLAEEEDKYEVGANKMLILLPDKHHFSWKATDEKTNFYWLHFYTTAKWEESDRPSTFISDLPIPELHYHQRSYTLHLRKMAELKETDTLYSMIEEILRSTESNDADGIWKTEELFLRFLQFIENQGTYKSRKASIAEKVLLYLENNFEKKVTTQILSHTFHLHRNYIAESMKEIFGKTAMEMLTEIRMNAAKKYLLRTDKSVEEIARLVGYSTDIYFSGQFKKYEGISPSYYRKEHKL